MQKVFTQSFHGIIYSAIAIMRQKFLFSFFFVLSSFFFEYILILPFYLKKKTFHIQKISGNSQHGKSENGIFLSKLRRSISAVARAVQELRRMEYFGGRNRGEVANENFR
jgi:hypothetical protein